MGTTTETVIHYVTDTRASQFMVQVFSGGFLSAFGHSPTIAICDFSGEATVDPDDVDRSSLKVTIKAESLAVKMTSPIKTGARSSATMQQEILETDRFPEILYECSNVASAKSGEGNTRITLNGDLTLHGVTRSQSISARVAFNGDSLRAFGTFTVRQTDYDLKLASVAGAH